MATVEPPEPPEASVAAVTVLAVEGSAAVIGLAVEHSAAVAASADSAAAAGADGNNLGLGFASNFAYNQKNSVNPLKQTYEKTINSDGYRQYRHDPGTNGRIRSDCRQRE